MDIFYYVNNSLGKNYILCLYCISNFIALKWVLVFKRTMELLIMYNTNMANIWPENNISVSERAEELSFKRSETLAHFLRPS